MRKLFALVLALGASKKAHALVICRDKDISTLEKILSEIGVNIIHYAELITPYLGVLYPFILLIFLMKKFREKKNVINFILLGTVPLSFVKSALAQTSPFLFEQSCSLGFNSLKYELEHYYGKFKHDYMLINPQYYLDIIGHIAILHFLYFVGKKIFKKLKKNK